MTAGVGEDALTVTVGVTDGVSSIVENVIVSVKTSMDDTDPDVCATATAQMADSRRMV